MGLHFSINGIFITRMKLGDTKNHKNDPAMRQCQSLVGLWDKIAKMVASPEAGKGGGQIYLRDLQKEPILLRSLCQMSQGTVRMLFSGTSSGALWYEHLGRSGNHAWAILSPHSSFKGTPNARFPQGNYSLKHFFPRFPMRRNSNMQHLKESHHWQPISSTRCHHS